MTRPWRVRLHTLGCRLNEAELEDWSDAFARAGLGLAGEDEPADLVVVNTCAVTREAARKSRQILRRGQRLNPGARLVVSGCLATLEAQTLARESGIDLVIANADKDRLVAIALATLAIPTMPELAVTDPAGLLFRRGRQRAFVKVQDGCRYQCTFCITTQARGAERSRPADEVVAAVRRLQRGGIQEVVLTGVHLGGYGRAGDDTAGLDLAGLVARLLAETEIPRLRLGSLEPWDLPEPFWGLFANPRLMPHLHLPLQSGSDAILKCMARRCKTAEFARLLETGRAAVPGLNVTTDIIVGFPGETEQDWQQTLEVAESMGFGDIHVFGYSPRAGTPAAGLPGRVPAEVLKARCLELQSLAARLRLRVLHAQVGRRVQVLCEGAGEPGGGEVRLGYTPNYLPIRLRPARSRGEDRLSEVVVTGVDPDEPVLVGEVVPEADRDG